MRYASEIFDTHVFMKKNFSFCRCLLFRDLLF